MIGQSESNRGTCKRIAWFIYLPFISKSPIWDESMFCMSCNLNLLRRFSRDSWMDEKHTLTVSCTFVVISAHSDDRSDLNEVIHPKDRMHH